MIAIYRYRSILIADYSFAPFTPMEVNTPATMPRRSGRIRIPNVNRHEVLTLREVAEVRSQFTGESSFTRPGGPTSTLIGHPVNAHSLQGVDASTNQPHISCHEMLEMSVSALFGSLHLDRTDAGRVDRPEGKVPINLLVCRIDRRPAPEVAIQPSIQDGTSISPATPRVDSDLPLPKHTSPVVSNTPHSEGLPLSQSDEDLLLSQETQVEEEIRGEYRWLCALLAENEERAWGTVYRDFIGVRLMLSAAQGMGMEELSNNQIGNGAF